MHYMLTVFLTTKCHYCLISFYVDAVTWFNFTLTNVDAHILENFAFYWLISSHIFSKLNKHSSSIVVQKKLPVSPMNHHFSLRNFKGLLFYSNSWQSNFTVSVFLHFKKIISNLRFTLGLGVFLCIYISYTSLNKWLVSRYSRTD